MKELSKEDQERIERAALFTMPVIGESFFTMGAKYEHEIAYNKGFNEAIEEVQKLYNTTRSLDHFFDEVKKLKK